MARIVPVLGVGLPALILSAALALAQGAPPPAPKAPDPAAGPAPVPPQTPPAAPGPGAMAAPGGPPEGMVVETPNGFYLIRPGEGAPRRLDLGRPGPGGPGTGPAMGEGPANGGPPSGDEMAEGAPRLPPGRPGAPPRPPEGKGARIDVKTPNLALDVKCPDDEPLRTCVDAVSRLLDKANAPGH